VLLARVVGKADLQQGEQWLQEDLPSCLSLASLWRLEWIRQHGSLSPGTALASWLAVVLGSCAPLAATCAGAMVHSAFL